MNNMRILVVQDGDWTKKGPHQQHHLMERLSLKGHEIRVIGFDQLWRSGKEGFISEREEFTDLARFYEGAKITFISSCFIKLPILDYVSFLFSSRKEIKRSMEEFKPDIVIGFTSVLSNYWGMKFARDRGIPFVYYWTDVIHTLIPFRILRPLAKLIEKKIIKHSTMVMIINDALRDYVISFGADPSLTRVIPAGVNFEYFDPSKIDRFQVREKYGLSKEDFVLFYMGWIYEFSGLKEIILELI
ncbi:MAG: glycosyltransferase, partial [Thermoplasmata archaeon]|nr:glycosyltransferase [Thermoplasmata archaeon]